MTRTAIQSQYNWDRGIIVSPGKFQGEPIYAPYYYDLYLKGGGETYDHEDYYVPVTDFSVTSEDREEFPELKFVSLVRLFVREDGFVTCDRFGVSPIYNVINLQSQMTKVDEFINEYLRRSRGDI